MKKYLVLLSLLHFVCFAVDAAVSTYGGYAQVGYAMNQNMNSNKPQPQPDELKIDGKYYYCNRVLYPGGTNYAGGDVLTVVYSDKKTVKQFECVDSSGPDDKWVEDTDIFCPSSPLQNMKTANSYVALLHNGKYVSGKYSVISGTPNVGTTVVYNGNACVWAACDYNYKEQDGKCVRAETKPKDCVTTSHGDRGDVDCAGADPSLANADKCTALCDNGSWRGYEIVGCVNGYFIKDNECRKYGSVCDKNDMPKFATDGQYVKGRNGAECAATQCKKGAYLVVKKGKKDESLGRCVPGTHCDEEPGTKLNIIDGTKTDLQCVKIKSDTSGNGAPVKKSMVGKDTNKSPAENNNANDGNNGNATVVVNNPNQNTPQGNGGGGDNSVTPVPNVEMPGDENPQPTNNVPVDGGACKSADKNATAGIYEDGVCVPALCRDGFEIVKYVCVEIGGDCDEMPENASAAHRAWDAQGGRVVCVIDDCEKNYNLSDDKMTCEQDKKAVAQDALDKAKAKEQSTENKLLGGATMAATGIGGMQAMSAMAEQSADADAEEAMRAYLATFHCNYGGGMNIPGGEKDVQLPGGNELVGLYSEYVNLANDLKVRKNALGMKPGIESESILDSATSGLYDDVAIGKTSGAFTSLARAMMDPNGADAAAWAAQKSDTANKFKTGATMAGIGAVGGAVGNLLINNDKDDDKSKNSDAKKEDKKFDKQKVGQDDVKKLTDTVKQKVSKSQQQKSGGQNEAQNQVAADAVVVASVTEISDGDVTAQDIDNSNITDSNATLDALAREFEKQPSDSVRAAWNKFAEQCGGYKGILSLEESDAHAGGYELLCEFVDLKQTDENIKKFYATELGYDYFTTNKNNINHKLQIEKTDEYKKSDYGQNDIKASERMAEMNSTWANIFRYVDMVDGNVVSAIGRYRALIYVKPDMSLVMKKHNNDNMTEYTVK